MDIPLNAAVQCTDGPCGRSTHVIVVATTRQVTHLVVQDSGAPPIKHLVAIDEIVTTSPDAVSLRCSSAQLAASSTFVDVASAPTDQSAPAHGADVLALEADLREPLGVLPGEFAVYLGTHVWASNGNVGLIDEFLVDPATRRITHLVLRESHAWGHRGFVIPVDQVDRLDAMPVRINMDRHTIEALPAIPVKRWRHRV